MRVERDMARPVLAALAAAGGFLAVIGLVALPAFADPAPAASLARAVQPVAPPAASQQQVLYLVRATLLSLDDANRTGNYSVLRELGSPGFQQAHSAADLAGIFAELRHKRIPLTAAAIAEPNLTATPVIEAEQILRLTGYLPTAPLRLSFDLRFEPAAGDWRLAALSVGAQVPQEASQAQKPAAAAARPAGQPPVALKPAATPAERRR